MGRQKQLILWNRDAADAFRCTTEVGGVGGEFSTGGRGTLLTFGVNREVRRGRPLDLTSRMLLLCHNSFPIIL